MADDDVGGAMLTGVVAYESLEARLAPLKPNPFTGMTIQGLEVDRIIRCQTRPDTLNIDERDEVEVVWPPQSEFYHMRFRIIKIQRDSLHPLDRRNFLELQLHKIEVSRARA